MASDESPASPVAEFVDTHVHVACADGVTHPRRPTGVGSNWWAQADGTADVVLEEAAAAGARHVVVVQAVGAYGFDNSCAAAAVGAASGFASLVAAPDMGASDPVASLAAVVNSPHLTGLRLFGVGDGAPWLDDGRGDDVMQFCGARGLVAVATIFADRLPSLSRLVQRHPGVAVALDHCAFPDMATADMGAGGGERALFELADLSDLHLKVTTHVLAAWRAERRLEQVADRLVAEFGAARLCWGSDHPQHQGLDYRAKVQLALDATVGWSVADRFELFTGTAHRLGWG